MPGWANAEFRIVIRVVLDAANKPVYKVAWSGYRLNSVSLESGEVEGKDLATCLSAIEALLKS